MGSIPPEFVAEPISSSGGPTRDVGSLVLGPPRDRVDATRGHRVVHPSSVHPYPAPQTAAAVARDAQARLGPQVELDLLGQQELVVEQVRDAVARPRPR